MVPTSFDPSVLFATEHGTLRWASDERLVMSLADRAWTISPEEVSSLHEAMETLAARVYRCDCNCRWQLRVGEHETAVLGTEDVLQLHTLLRGGAVMLELHDLLDDAAVDPCWGGEDEAHPASEA